MSSQPRPSPMRAQPHVPALLGDPCPGLASYNSETLAVSSASSSPSLSVPCLEHSSLYLIHYLKHSSGK